jgi:hypothetical protein
MGDERTAKPERVGCARPALCPCSLCEGRGGQDRRGQQRQRHAPPRQRHRPKHPVVLAFHVHHRTRIHNRNRYPRWNTLLLEFALVAKHQPLELSIPLRSFGFGRICKVPSSVCFAINIGAHKPPSHHRFVQASGSTPALTFHVETDCLCSTDPRSCWDTSQDWRPDTRTGLR